jgi:hypothetical protein
MVIKNRKRRKNAGMIYGMAIGMVIGLILKHFTWGYLIGAGIGGTIDIIYYSRLSKRN